MVYSEVFMGMAINDDSLRDAALTYAKWNQDISKRPGGTQEGNTTAITKTEAEYFSELAKPQQEKLIQSIETLMAFFKQNTEDEAFDKLQSLDLGKETMLIGKTKSLTVGPTGIGAKEEVTGKDKVLVNLASRVSPGRVEASSKHLRGIYYQAIGQQVPVEQETAKEQERAKPSFFDDLKGRFGWIKGGEPPKTK